MDEKQEVQKLNEITIKFNDIKDNTDHSKEVNIKSTETPIEDLKKVAQELLKDDFRTKHQDKSSIY